jgi:hypothetical protein
MNRRQWHIAFLAALGARNAARMNDDDHDHMCHLRDEAVTPMTAARVIRAMLTARHGTIIR